MRMFVFNPVLLCLTLRTAYSNVPHWLLLYHCHAEWRLWPYGQASLFMDWPLWPYGQASLFMDWPLCLQTDGELAGFGQGSIIV